MRHDEFADECPEMRRWLRRRRTISRFLILGALLVAVIAIVFAGFHTLYFMPTWLRVFLPTFIPVWMFGSGLLVRDRTDPVYAPRRLRPPVEEHASHRDSSSDEGSETD